jgi:hypothetical protein
VHPGGLERHRGILTGRPIRQSGRR